MPGHAVPPDLERLHAALVALPREERVQVFKGVERGEALADPRLAAIAAGLAEERRRKMARSRAQRIWPLIPVLLALLTLVAATLGGGPLGLRLLLAAGMLGLGAAAFLALRRERARLERTARVNREVAALRPRSEKAGRT